MIIIQYFYDRVFYIYEQLNGDIYKLSLVFFLGGWLLGQFFTISSFRYLTNYFIRKFLR